MHWLLVKRWSKSSKVFRVKRTMAAKRQSSQRWKGLSVVQPKTTYKCPLSPLRDKRALCRLVDYLSLEGGGEEGGEEEKKKRKWVLQGSRATLNSRGLNSISLASKDLSWRCCRTDKSIDRSMLVTRIVFVYIVPFSLFKLNCWPRWTHGEITLEGVFYSVRVAGNRSFGLHTEYNIRSPHRKIKQTED